MKQIKKLVLKREDIRQLVVKTALQTGMAKVANSRPGVVCSSAE
jgi:hypothetical protein